jgi:hypothetical protein
VIDAYNPQFSHIEYGEKFKLISSAHTIRMWRWCWSRTYPQSLN